MSTGREEAPLPTAREAAVAYIASAVAEAKFSDVASVAAQAAAEVASVSVMTGVDPARFFANMFASRAKVRATAWEALRDYADGEFSRDPAVAKALHLIADRNDPR